MDISTIIGFVTGMVLVVWGITSSGDLGNFVDMQSLAIVLGGTFAAVFVSYPLQKVFNSIKVAKNAFTEKKVDQNKLISEIIALANVARKEGLLALEEAAGKTENVFLKKGIMLIVDGTDPELVRNVLETELNFLEERHGEGKDIFEAAGAYCPAFGMVGTLIGLINMLQGLEDFASVGPNMSVALVTTFYGSFFANLIFLPIAKKLSGRSREELLFKEMMVEGLLSIQAGENPRIIEEKLKTFIPPNMRVDSGSEGEGE